MLYAPMVMPEVVIGLALLLLFVSLGVERGFWTVVIAHATLGMCFVAVVVHARLARFDRSLEEAAMDLGATPVQTFVLVTLPLIAPSVDRGLPARLHDLARRFRAGELHDGTGIDDAADAHLFLGAPWRDAGDQRHLDAADRVRRGHGARRGC